MGELKPEPSMEDILASIKRIIADDSQAAEEAVSHVEQVASAGESTRFGSGPLHLVDDARVDDAPKSEEILELTQPIEQTESTPPARAEIQPETAQEEAVRPVEAFVSRNATQPTTPILSDDAASASRQSLAALSALLVKSESENGENTLEGLVREMLRPMMKDWLDQKLPEMVERLVEKEIARLTGRLA
jgi:cell pole-organizing protein PopZ